MELGHGSIGLGGAIVVIGIVIAIFGSPWAGIVVALIGLLLFGGFAALASVPAAARCPPPKGDHTALRPVRALLCGLPI